MELNEAKHLLTLLKGFNFNEFSDQNSETQGTARATEGFVENTLKKFFSSSRNVGILKGGSQQHPDFMIFLKTNPILKKLIEAHKLKFRQIKKAEEGFGRPLSVKLEVKAGKGNGYMLNDTFPPPYKDKREIYVLFNFKSRRVYINTSFNMASRYVTKPDITSRFKTSNKIVKGFSQKLKQNWEGTPIKTAARPTYRMENEYCEEDAPVKEIQRVFNEAGI